MKLSELSNNLEVLITTAQIQKACSELGNRITEDYLKYSEPLTVIGTLKGSAPFVADLIRKIDLPLRLDFVELSSYGNQTHSSGSVKINKDIKTSIEGHRVLLVEDIVDTGITFGFLQKLMVNREPVSVQMACLLKKPVKHLTDIHIEYCGYEIDDHFVVGYGLDYRGLFRNLDQVCILDESSQIIADSL